MTYVIKRDGSKVKWDSNKIVNAVRKAFESCKEEDKFNENEFKEFANSFTANTIDIESIQDAVEYYLIGNYPNIAKAYIIYRKERAKIRDFKYNKTYYNTVLGLLNGETNDVSKENANKDPKQFFTMRDLVAGETCKKIYKDFIMDSKLLELHNKGIIHVHDTDYRAMKGMTNCCLINLKDMLINGTCVQGKRIHNIHSLIVASNVTTQIIAAVGSSQYGGITIDISHLSPFIERSKIKYRDIFKELDGPIQEKYVNAFIKKEIVDSIQLIQYQLNTLTTTNGQSPFITIACNTNGQDDEYPEYTAMLIEELLKQRIKGMEGPNGNNINPSFPKIVYILTENNIKEGTKYYYLTKLAAECTAKRMVPDYMSEKICKQYKEGRVIPPMGCRSILTPWKNKEGKYQEFGRFNIGVFSINLPYLALDSTTIEEFKEKLVDMIDFLSEQQYKVYKTICNQPVDIAPILWMDGAFFRAKSGQKIGEILPKGYCTASIGYIGLAECAYRFNIDYPTEEGQKFGLDIMKVFYDRVQFNAKKYNLSLSIYGTPAENTTTTFAKALKIFPTIKNVNDKKYVTNSYHIPVWYNIDGYNKIKFEAPFQKYSSGGCISYVEMPDINHNAESVLNIMQYIYDHMMYCELNTTSCDVCYKCGFHGQIELLGDNNFRCPNCGNTNSLSLYIQRRLCGYLGTLTNGISIGREGDIMDRAKHF
jgi:ribonucleoside-triphosphate reductase